MQWGERRAPSSRRSRRRMGRTVNAVSSHSCNVAMLPDLLPSIITPVVRDSAALVAQLPRSLDMLEIGSVEWT